MRRFLVTLVLPILALAAVEASAETVRIMAGVEVRSYSSPEAPVIGALAKGTVIEVVAREGSWVRILIPESGYPGYVPAVFCQVVQGVAPYTPPPAPVPAAPVPVAPAYQPQAAPVASPPQTYTPQPPTPAPAQATYAVADSPQREGFWIGFGLGYGSQKGCDDFFECGDREGGLSGYIKLGGTLNPQLLLGVESIGWAKEVEGTDLTVGGLLGTVTVYPVASSGFFLKGGAGLSYWKISEGSISVDKTGWAFTGGLGYDLRVSRNISITPSASYLYGNVGDLDEFGLTGLHGDLFQFALGVTFH